MSLLGLIFVQAVAVQAATSSADRDKPTLEIRARMEAHEIEIKSEATAETSKTASPDGPTDETAERNQPAGRSAYENLEIDYRLRVHLDQPQEGLPGSDEGPETQNRETPQ